MSDAAFRPDPLLIGNQSFADTVRRAVKTAPSSIDEPRKLASCTTDVWFSAFFDGTSNSIFDEDPRPLAGCGNTP